MEHCKDQNRDDDHDALEDNEFCLVAHELASPAAGKLRDTVYASDEDAEEAGNDGEDEAAEGCLAKKYAGLVGNLVATARGAKGVCSDAESKDCKDDDLEDDTSNLRSNSVSIRRVRRNTGDSP